ncbi:probable trehalose-phosphate phosphatase 2 [Ananas comosus]|uniref:Trehalose 6-phosphate phosphatase n=2 Tax=Ananas comosus TaxID=4615 RepID=A0A6P5FPM1_ANACO|nr:probable trehalose-phosphate phosphatase 2 [Ananas comosus]CAD1835119.1 unnamed protein product [Ananas comosus var. bracteatus]
MDLKTNHSSPVITDPVPVNNSILGLHSSMMPYASSSVGYNSSGMYANTPRKKAIPGKLGEIRANSLLDAMTASSPPRKKLNKEFGLDAAIDETDPAYRAWTMRYPSALTSFDQITGCAKGKKLALFLDYDGTLSPIVDNPDNAIMSDAMREAVKNVAKCIPTAIISGRSRDKVFEFVKLTELYYAGSHGMDIMGPVRKSEPVGHRQNCIRTTDKQGKEVNLFQPAGEFLPMIDEVFRSLVEIVKDIDGAHVENNKFCASVHYRNVDPKDWDDIGERVNAFLKAYPRLRLTHGRKVLEVRPVIDWNKGKAVEFLLESLGLSDCDDVLPIYVGDDKTDEDAFKVLRERSHGFGILVSTVPKETDAFYTLRDPSEVMEFLKSLVRWKEAASEEYEDNESTTDH